MEKTKFFLIQHKRAIVAICTLVAMLVVTGIVIYFLAPLLSSISTDTGREAFKEYIASKGILGVLMMIGLQMIQIIIAVIPGEPVELLSGMLYGTWGGLFLSLFTCAISTALVFFAVKKIGYPLVEVFFKKEQIRKFSFLQNAQKLDIIIFILFFVPGTPKDLLTYFAGLTPIKLPHFLVISTIARIPSIITSTYAGATLLEGDWIKTIIAFAITALLGILGILFGNKIINKTRNLAHDEKKKTHDTNEER